MKRAEGCFQECLEYFGTRKFTEGDLEAEISFQDENVKSAGS